MATYGELLNRFGIDGYAVDPELSAAITAVRQGLSEQRRRAVQLRKRGNVYRSKKTKTSRSARGSKIGEGGGYVTGESRAANPDNVG